MQTYPVGQFLNKKFIGTNDLRRDLSDIIDKVPGEQVEIVLTQHGKPKMILLDLDTYLQLTDIQEDIIQPGYINSLYKELEKVKKGKGITHEKLMKKLKLNV